MSKLKMVRKEKVKENPVVVNHIEVRCGNPECKAKIKIDKHFTFGKLDGTMKIGPCVKAVWICDLCRSKGMLKVVRQVANEHIFEEHMIRNFFPNL